MAQPYTPSSKYLLHSASLLVFLYLTGCLFLISFSYCSSLISLCWENAQGTAHRHLPFLLCWCMFILRFSTIYVLMTTHSYISSLDLSCVCAHSPTSWTFLSRCLIVASSFASFRSLCPNFTLMERSSLTSQYKMKKLLPYLFFLIVF